MKKRVHFETECIIVRGVNKEQIVRDSSDRVRLTSALLRFAEALSIPITAYSLSKNQLRILTTAGSEVCGELVKRLASSYVRHHFNPKYNRCGNLFTQRYIVEGSEEAGGLTSLIKEVYSLIKHEKNGLNSEFSSFAATLASFEENGDTMEKSPFDFSPIRALCSKDSLINLLNVKDIYYFGRKAYTPSEATVKNYLIKICGGKSFSQLSQRLQRYVVSTLRCNKVRTELISLLTGLGIPKLRAILA